MSNKDDATKMEIDWHMNNDAIRINMESYMTVMEVLQSYTSVSDEEYLQSMRMIFKVNATTH